MFLAAPLRVHATTQDEKVEGQFELSEIRACLSAYRAFGTGHRCKVTTIRWSFTRTDILSCHRV